MITFQDVWASSTDLLKRFGLMPTRKAAYLKMAEESQEYAEAIYELAENPKHILLRQDAAKECADVIVTAFNIAYTAGLTIGEIESAMRATMVKNDAKSDETHHIVNGQIARREKVQS